MFTINHFTFTSLLLYFGLQIYEHWLFFSFQPHIKMWLKLHSSSQKHCQSMALLTQAHAERLMHAIIMSRFHCCNAWWSFSAQHVQNTAAPKVLTRTRNKAHIMSVLKSLHRLPLNSGVYFKILWLVFKALNSLAPEYN